MPPHAKRLGSVFERLELLKACYDSGIINDAEFIRNQDAFIQEERENEESAKAVDYLLPLYMPMSEEVWGTQEEAKIALRKRKSTCQEAWKFMYNTGPWKDPPDLVYKCALHAHCKVRCKISKEPNGFMLMKKSNTIHSVILGGSHRKNGVMTAIQDVSFIDRQCSSTCSCMFFAC